MRPHSLIIAALLACSAACSAPEPASERASDAVLWPGLTDAAHDHVNHRLDQIEALPEMRGGALFLGDSITEGAPLYAMFPELQTANHGIAWDTTQGVLLRLGQVTRHTPDRIFLLIGTNDTNYTDDPAQISSNILEIADQLRAALPQSELYVLSILPRGGASNAVISSANLTLDAEANAHDYVYLDLASPMRAPNGEMQPALSYDNLHLNVHGYAVWEATLRACVWRGCPSGLTAP